jgi:hypothetical protein
MTTMQIDRVVVEQALEALEWHYRQGHSNTLGGFRLKIDEKALRNLRAALAQQDEPVEPVAWIQPDHLQKARVAPFLCRVEPTQRCADFVPLYLAPPKAEPVQEPVAWLDPWTRNNVTTDYDAYGKHGIPLYTAPPQRLPLTEGRCTQWRKRPEGE